MTTQPEQKTAVDMGRVLRYTFAMLFVVGGINHFVNTAAYVRVMPPYLPSPQMLVFLSGICEIGLGILLLVPQFTRLAAWGLIALLLAVFPANIEMAIHPLIFPQVPQIVLYLRLPLQFVLIYWAYRYTKPIVKP